MKIDIAACWDGQKWKLASRPLTTTQADIDLPRRSISKLIFVI
jgi:hypothetical protein